MKLPQPFHPVGVDLKPGLAQEHIGEQPPAHPDLAVDAPDGERDPFRLERFMPSQYVLIDAVDEGAVEIKEKACLWGAHGLLLQNQRSAWISERYGGSAPMRPQVRAVQVTAKVRTRRSSSMLKAASAVTSIRPISRNAASRAPWKLSPAPTVSTTLTCGAGTSTAPAPRCQARTPRSPRVIITRMAPPA